MPNEDSSGATLTRLMYRTASPVADDQDLLRLAREDGSGSPAWDVIVDRYGGFVWSVCRRQSFCANEADDAAQLTFFLLFRTLSDPLSPPVRSLSGWLARVANRVACRVRKRGDRERAKSSTPIDQQHPAQVEPDRTASQDTDRLVVEELSRLPERYQTAIFETKFNGLTAADAARRLGTRETTVRKWVERGLKRLEAGLRRRGVKEVTAITATLGLMTSSAVGLDAARWLTGVRTESVAHIDPSLTAVSQLSGCTSMVKKVLVAGGLVAAAGVIASAFVWPGPTPVTRSTVSTPPVEASVVVQEVQPATQVTRFELLLWRSVAGEQKTQFMGKFKSNVGVIPVVQDRIACDVELDEVAACLLFQVLPDGSAVACEPSDPTAVPELQSALRFPELDRHGEARLTEHGNQAFVLIVLKRPESFATWSGRFGGKFLWEGVKGEGLWYAAPPAAAVSLRPVGGKLELPSAETADPLNKLCKFLAQQENVESVRAFGFNPRRQQPKK
jgi:RNA polymerase sigma factor (sigma-70 family)